MVLEDADSSLSQFTPVLNTGDKAMIFVDTAACFGGTGIDEEPEDAPVESSANA